MLEDIQQRLPERIAVVLGNQEELYFKTEDFIHHYCRLKVAFVEFHRDFSADRPPEDLSGLNIQ